MPRKRYILLKDTPELRANAIVEEICDNGDQDYAVISKDWCQKDDQNQTQYTRKVVMESPDWFEEITPLYLTKKQFEKVKQLIGDILPSRDEAA